MMHMRTLGNIPPDDAKAILAIFEGAISRRNFKEGE